MHFVQFLKSLDELLYEMMSWLIFYPITMVRTLLHPWRMMDYADSELDDRIERQYTDTLSPPLFLFLSLFISHGIELALVGDSPIVADTRGLHGLIMDDTSLLIMRLLIFSTFPLIMAARLVRARGVGLTRDTLRPPFYSQCYVAAPFVLLVMAADTLAALHRDWTTMAAAVIFVAAFLWYGVLQSRWFSLHLNISLPRGFLMASVAMVECLIVLGIAVWLFH